jgi:serine/threonine protein kinase/WD40 repeat protein
MSTAPNTPNPEDQPEVDSETELLAADESSIDPRKSGISEENAPDSDSSKTVLYDATGSGSGHLSDSKSGSSAKTPGSDERLRREWDEAIGTSGKGSGESLRFERPEASDSVLDRIAVRKVADANINRSERPNFDYCIQDKLGEGGMGIVFSATQTAVNRVVALKTLKKDQNIDPATQKQFFYEAEITADLDHPNIPPIYELGMTEQGTFFYTMKLIKGSEWQRVMSKRSLDENLEIFEKLADAIGFAHSKQILHLDIKPENVIVGGYGEVYVSDWGLAHNLSKKVPLRAGGTPDYMAPEMARKAIDRVQKQTDIYLLGAVLFRIVTGYPPHAGAETKDRKKAAYSKLIDAYHNKIRPSDSDNPLLQVALKAMSTEPADRYATVEDMQSAVREIVRENANIKTSLELTKSSKSTAQLAEKSQDYERFNRAIFGFRNAIEVWTGNKEAEAELAKARLAFGKCAFAKGDFDLALQTLDRKVPEEASLLDKAQKAKIAVLNRESRFKFLRNAFIGLLALGGVGATAASIWINAARTEAVKQKGIAEANEKKAVDNYEEAERQRGFAETKKEEAERARKAEQEQRTIAEMKKEEAERAQKAEQEQRTIAEMKKEEAERAQQAEQEQRTKAQESERTALARLAQVEVGQQLTNLGFASAQADQANPIGAASLLGNLKIDEKAEQAFGGRIPALINWASRRVELLSNRDLRPQELAGKVTAIDFAKGRNLGVAGLSDGRVVALELKDGRLIERSSAKVGSYVVTTAISPSADEAMLAIADNARGEGAKLYRWPLAGEVEPMQEETTKNRFFQGFAYSPDGSSVVAGIRGGVWIKKKGSDWGLLTSRVKGELLDVDWLDDRRLLVLAADLDGDRNLYFIGMPESNRSEPESTVVAQPEALRRNRITQLGVLGDNKLIVASEGGGLATYNLSVSFDPAGVASKPQASLENGQVLPKRHRSTVTQIDIDPSGRMVTGSRESVVHVWRFEPNSGLVNYETFLTGAPGEASKENVIDRTAFVDGLHVVNVDNAGTAVALDIDRQKQRRELTRDLYERVVIGIHPRGTSSEVLSVDENGAVDKWDLATGKTLALTAQKHPGPASRYSYFGHTPGASLFDTAIDAQRGVVVTSAVLPSIATRYAGDLDATKAWAEFCVWDQATGNMLRRWQSEMNEPAEPRLTLLGGGMFYAGNEAKTVVFDYQGQGVFADLPGKGATFAVVNPHRPSLIGMFRRDGGKGRVWLWNRESGETPEMTKDAQLEESIPVHAAWSNDGQRLYVLDMSGTIIPYSVSDGELVRDKKAIVDLKDRTILNALRSFQDIDWFVRSYGAGDSVICSVRERAIYRAKDGSANDRTTTITCNFAVDGKSVRLESEPQREIQSRLLWPEAHPTYSITPEPQILSKRRAGNQVFISMKNGRVYGLNPQGGNPVLYGRQKCVMSTSDRQGDRLMLLNEDGSVHLMNVKDGSDLKLANYRVEPGEKRIALSPDSQQLAVYNSDRKSIRVLAADNGQILREIQGVLEFEWDPEQGAGLATLAVDGSLKIEGEAQPIRNLSAEIGARKPSRLTFFNERWSDPNQASSRYVAIQVEDKVMFVSREPEGGVFEETIGQGVQLAVSPKDSILATGDSTGTIRIWFASPKNKICRKVYDLDRQDESGVTRIAFSGDGDTLIASDSKKRISAWMSQDKLSSGR